MILIISNKWDVSVDFVVSELRRRAQPFVRINTEELAKERASISLPNLDFSVTKNGKLQLLHDNISAIWNRRPGRIFDYVDKETHPTRAIRDFIHDQWYTWLEALILLPRVTWMNHPIPGNVMENKAKQLAYAEDIGFRIPSTLISNDPEKVINFARNKGDEVVAKALFSPLLEEPNRDSFIFANRVTVDQLEAGRHQIRLSPVIFQECFTNKRDIRVTVIGEYVYAAEVVRATEQMNEIDWRADKSSVDFVPHELPKEINDKCREYVLEAGLLFGAIDLILVDCAYIFLEINPNGEWGWLQKLHGFPIAQAICKTLIHQDHGS